ncbi:MAG: type 1 glutamine amidotransferase [Aeoliella sp.]
MDANELRYLLFQVRKREDPMREQEIDCFASALGCDAQQIEVLDLIHEIPTAERLHDADAVLMGGSGDFSVAEGGDWLEAALASMRHLHEIAKPTFGSCWGFQAMARALGGKVITDMGRAEIGNHEIRLTDAGRADPLFGPLGESFFAHEGHQDIVTQLPAGATLLASTKGVNNQAFTFPGRPIYCTQFHPELSRCAFLERVTQYPEYVERIAGVPLETFATQIHETPNANELLGRFVQHVFGG